MEILNDFVDNYKEQIIETLQKTIQIPSYEREAMEGMPFGKEVNDAMEYFLKTAQDMGFETKNIDGYAGHVHWGDPHEFVGILVHLDVVPEGNSWRFPPYGGEIHNGKLYGRGAVDNKGPAVSCLYALKAIKDLGLKTDKGIRLILGLDEESGWLCMDHYFKREMKPVVGFSPDAVFPIINAEKGILLIKITKMLKPLKISGGNRPNMVPDSCSCILPKDWITDANTMESIETHIIDNEVEVTSKGVSAHGSTPEKGVNAISKLMEFLERQKIEGEMKEFIKMYNRLFGKDTDGKGLGINYSDDISGNLVLNVGTIKSLEDEISFEINIRYPVTIDMNQVIDPINKRMEEFGAKVELSDFKKPLYVPSDTPLIKTLQRVYNEYTGQEGTLIAIGGGTYARAIDNCVAFGPLFPGDEDTVHQKDEYIEVSKLIDITKIYGKAMLELAK
jgi:succinyl-diaminopimelate desuccinylase